MTLGFKSDPHGPEGICNYASMRRVDDIMFAADDESAEADYKGAERKEIGSPEAEIELVKGISALDLDINTQGV
jgi:hypothetical protein